MSPILVEDPGMFTTIQDGGRPGHAHLGVAQGGAFDTLSMTICNRILGNRDDAPGLEITLTGPTLFFQTPTLICLSDPCSAVLPGGRAIMAFEPTLVPAGFRLALGRVHTPPRAFMAFARGLAADRAMGSASTHVSGGFGGLQGRALRAADTLALSDEPAGEPVQKPERSALTALLRPHALAAVPSPWTEHFPEDAIDAFFGATFTLTPRCDRVGLALGGPAVPTRVQGRLISRGMAPGAVQIPESGQPIILGVDHPTTGGYPVIATIAAAHLDALARLKPGDAVRFEPITPEQGRRLWRQKHAALDAALPRR